MTKGSKTETIRDRHYDLAYWDAEWQEWTPLGRHLDWSEAVDQYRVKMHGCSPGPYRIILVENETKLTDMTGLYEDDPSQHL